jgi:phosphoenolpyruvate synthase/pyruvate phosphate dikinase
MVLYLWDLREDPTFLRDRWGHRKEYCPRRVIAVMEEHGLEQGENGLEIFAMGEIPNNVIQIVAYAQLFDGLSIGSNDLT